MVRRGGMKEENLNIIDSGYDKDKSGSENYLQGFNDAKAGLKGTFQTLATLGHVNAQLEMKLEDFKHKPKWWKEIIIEEISEWDLKKLFNL